METTALLKSLYQVPHKYSRPLELVTVCVQEEECLAKEELEKFQEIDFASVFWWGEDVFSKMILMLKICCVWEKGKCVCVWLCNQLVPIHEPVPNLFWDKKARAINFVYRNKI